MSTANGAATQTSVATSTTSAAILATNAAKRVWVVWNDSAAILYLTFGAGPATATNATVAVAANGYYECPQPIYGGPLSGILASGTGNARVTTW